MKKKYLVPLVATMSAFLLSGCSAEQHSGTFYEWFVEPLDKLLKYLYDMTGAWWLAILLITILVRTIILPFMLKMYKNQSTMSVGMAKVKPEIEAIQLETKVLQEKIKHTSDPAEVNKLKVALQEKQSEMMSVYRKHGVNPMGSIVGCLPMIITMPIFTGLFFALKSPVYSSSISDATFLSLSLGKPSLILTIVAGIIYFLQARISLINTPPEQREQMKLMTYISPIMIVVISYTSAGALALYWIFGGIYMIAQTYLGKKLYPPVVSEPSKEVVQQAIEKEEKIASLTSNKSKVVSRKKKKK